MVENVTMMMMMMMIIMWHDFHRNMHHMWAIAVMKEVYSIQRHAKSIDVDLYK
jgi:hypothetical protein